VRATLGGDHAAGGSIRNSGCSPLAKSSGGEPRSDYKLLRVAAWESGLAVAGGKAGRSVRSLVNSGVKWVAREPGSAARQCLEQLLRGRVTTRRIAYDHWTVAEAIRCGWGEAGVCPRLTCEEARLTFLHVQNEFYDLCYAADDEGDPRIAALLRLLRTSACRRQIGELPGYDSSGTGHTLVITEN
jgi:molybdate-binding protein